MLSLQKNWRIALLIFYFICINILFFLPGSDLPSENWMTRIYFDKWVHTGLFMALSFLCCWTFGITEKKGAVSLLMLTIAYGFLIEVLQGAFTASRSYDLTDLLADSVGSVLGILLWLRWAVKK